MSHLFSLCTLLGSSAIALWCYVRFPGLRPARLPVAVAHVLLGLIAMNAAPPVVRSVGEFAPPYSMVFGLVGIVLPVLCYIFLSWVWLLARLRNLGSSGPRGGRLADAKS